jgi:hypothetical protein
MREQTIKGESGAVRLRTKEDGGMDSTILQNPSDPEATYREKNGKQHRGYVANVVESVGDNGSVITDYNYEQNTFDDGRFLNETIDEMGKQIDEVTIVADGAYDSADNRVKAAENNIRLVTTELKGRPVKDILAEFKFSDDGQSVIECAAGIKPKSSGYIKTSKQCRMSMYRDNCANCIHKDKCKPKIFKRTAVLFVSVKASERAKIYRNNRTAEIKSLTKFRNGVESVPSTLRRRYGVDKMPVRGKTRTKLYFGFKIAAFNFRKLMKYFSDPENGRLMPAII